MAELRANYRGLRVEEAFLRSLEDTIKEATGRREEFLELLRREGNAEQRKIASSRLVVEEKAAAPVEDRGVEIAVQTEEDQFGPGKLEVVSTPTQTEDWEVVKKSRRRRVRKDQAVANRDVRNVRKGSVADGDARKDQAIAAARGREDSKPSSNTRRRTQCWKCQHFGHRQDECQQQGYTCTYCTGPHESWSCKQPRGRGLPARCANCGGDHPALWKMCPRRPRGHRGNSLEETILRALARFLGAKRSV